MDYYAPFIENIHAERIPKFNKEQNELQKNTFLNETVLLLFFNFPYLYF